MTGPGMERLSEVAVPIADAGLPGFLGVPVEPEGVVVFAHGSGSGRFSPRNQAVAAGLRADGLATFLVDLLTPGEEADRRNVFDINLITRRLVVVTEWLDTRPELAGLPLGYFGASTGAAAAIRAAGAVGDRIGAVVSRGGRPDLAHPDESRIAAPTLLIVGGLDHAVLDLNRAAYAAMRCTKDLVVVDGAGHLFEEPGTLDEVTALATEWFRRHLVGPEEAA